MTVVHYIVAIFIRLLWLHHSHCFLFQH